MAYESSSRSDSGGVGRGPVSSAGPRTGRFSRQSAPFGPSSESIELVTRLAADLSCDDPKLVPWFEQYRQANTRRIATDIEILRETAPLGARIVEFGSIPLLLTGPLIELGYQVTGVDLAPERFETAIRRLGASVVRCDIEAEPLPLVDGDFDVAVFNELFEHLRINPIRTMREVRRVLKPGGILLLSTPNLRSAAGFYNFLLRDRASSCCADPYTAYESLDKVGHMGHVREYTVSEVSSFLERVGFSVERVVHRGEYRRLPMRVLTQLAPRLRPFATYVARAT